jgi:hypothetical protein
MVPDRHQEPAYIARQILIPNPPHIEATSFEIRIAFLVINNLVRVKWTIQFDDQLSFKANKIHDVRANQILAFEFVSAEFAISYFIPE